MQETSVVAKVGARIAWYFRYGEYDANCTCRICTCSIEYVVLVHARVCECLWHAGREGTERKEGEEKDILFMFPVGSSQVRFTMRCPWGGNGHVAMFGMSGLDTTWLVMVTRCMGWRLEGLSGIHYKSHRALNQPYALHLKKTHSYKDNQYAQPHTYTHWWHLSKSQRESERCQSRRKKERERAAHP